MTCCLAYHGVLEPTVNSLSIFLSHSSFTFNPLKSLWSDICVSTVAVLCTLAKKGFCKILSIRIVWSQTGNSCGGIEVIIKTMWYNYTQKYLLLIVSFTVLMCVHFIYISFKKFNITICCYEYIFFLKLHTLGSQNSKALRNMVLKGEVQFITIKNSYSKKIIVLILVISTNW